MGVSPLSGLSGFAQEEPILGDEEALVYFAPDFATFSGPADLAIDLMLAPGTAPVNVFSFSIAFDNSILLSAGIEFTDGHKMIILAGEADNENGVIELTGGLPGSSFSTTTVLARLYFSKTSAGTAEFSFLDAQLLTADGLGTAVPLIPEIHRLYLR